MDYDSKLIKIIKIHLDQQGITNYIRSDNNPKYSVWIALDGTNRRQINHNQQTNVIYLIDLGIELTRNLDQLRTKINANDPELLRTKINANDPELLTKIDKWIASTNSSSTT